MAAYNIILTTFFTTELFIRVYCYVHTYEAIVPFFYNPFRLVDLVVVLADITVAIVLAASNASRELSSVTALRLVRIIRAAR